MIEQLENRLFLSATAALNHTVVNGLASHLYMLAARAGNKAVIIDATSTDDDTASVYDETTGLVTHTFSPHNGYKASATIGNDAIFIRSGVSAAGAVDIFDSITDQWTSSTLAGVRFMPAAVAVGSVLVVVGGTQTDPSSTADIYNAITGRWTVSVLPIPILTTSGFQIGDQAFFPTPKGVDVYNSGSDMWSVMQSPKVVMDAKVLPGTVVGTTVIFPENLTYTFHSYNFLTDRWSTIFLAGAAPTIESGATLGNKAIFSPGGESTNQVIIYDSSANQWSRQRMSQSRFFAPPIVTVRDQTIISGGLGTNPFTTADVFTDPVPTATLNGNLTRTSSGLLPVAVHNAGDADLPAGSVIKIFATSATSATSRGVLLGEVPTNAPLAPGEVSLINVPITLLNRGLTGGAHGLVAAAVPPGRGHAILFASLLNAFSVRGPARTATREHLPTAAELVSPDTFSTQPIFPPGPAGVTDTPFTKDQREVLV